MQMLKYKYIFQIKYTEAILSNSTGKLLCFKITKMLIVVLENKFIVSFIIIFGTLSFPILRRYHSTLTSYQLVLDGTAVEL